MASRRQRALPHAGDGEVARAALALFAQGSSLFCHLGSEPGKIRLRASRLVKSTGIMRPEPNGTGSEQAKQDVPKMTNEGSTFAALGPRVPPHNPRLLSYTCNTVTRRQSRHCN